MNTDEGAVNPHGLGQKPASVCLNSRNINNIRFTAGAEFLVGSWSRTSPFTRLFGELVDETTSNLPVVPLLIY